MTPFLSRSAYVRYVYVKFINFVWLALLCFFAEIFRAFVLSWAFALELSLEHLVRERGLLILDIFPTPEEPVTAWTDGSSRSLEKGWWERAR